MKRHDMRVGLMLAAVCSFCISDLAFGQGYSRSSGSSSSKSYGSSRSSGNARGNASSNAGGYSGGNASGLGGQNNSYFGNNPFGNSPFGNNRFGNNAFGNSPLNGGRSMQRGSTSMSGSVSFMKDGKRIVIQEGSNGISVSIDGKKVRAKNAMELEKKYPEAYALYEEKRNDPKIRISGGAGGSARSGGSGSGTPGQSHTSSSQNRTVSLMENGKKISITENKSGISVSVNGKRVRAKNAAELERKFPEAFDLYQRHLVQAKSSNRPPDASALMRQELLRFRDQNANDPQLKSLIERMMENVPE